MNCTRPMGMLLAVGLVLGLSPAAGCRKPMTVGGNYPAVTESQLSGRDSSQRTGREKFDFVWKFDAGRFSIEGSRLPPDLLLAILKSEKEASAIAGTWSIDNGAITLKVDTVDEESAEHEAALPIYSTGVIRIDTLEAQYVF